MPERAMIYGAASLGEILAGPAVGTYLLCDINVYYSTLVEREEMFAEV